MNMYTVEYNIKNIIYYVEFEEIRNHLKNNFRQHR